MYEIPGLAVAALVAEVALLTAQHGQHRTAGAVPRWRPRGLTVPVLVGQPVVLGVTMLEVQVPLAALFLAEVGQRVRAVLGVAELEVVAKARAGTASVGRAGGESEALCSSVPPVGEAGTWVPLVGLGGAPESQV